MLYKREILIHKENVVCPMFQIGCLMCSMCMPMCSMGCPMCMSDVPDVLSFVPDLYDFVRPRNHCYIMWGCRAYHSCLPDYLKLKGWLLNWNNGNHLWVDDDERVVSISQWGCNRIFNKNQITCPKDIAI